MAGPTRGFSLRTATFVVVSSMVGGGVLTTSGFVALDLGSNTLMVGLWIMGGLIAACGALSLAEVSSALPRSGGEFAILSETYGPLVGFAGGWISLLFGFIAPIAATSSAAATYLLSAWGFTGDGTTRAVASLAILGFALAHSMGRSSTERVQGVVTAATIALLAGFVVLGLGAGIAQDRQLRDLPAMARWPGPSLFVGLIFVAYCYTGWNGASYLAGELDDPPRDLPRAILIGTSLVALLYLGLNVVYALGVPVAELREIADARGRGAVKPIAKLAARNLFGTNGAAVATGAMAVVLLASLSALIVTGPRVAFAMAERGRIPAVFSRVTRRAGAPSVAIGSVALAAILVLWSGSFEQILFASGVGLSLNSLLTVASVYVLRRRRPDLPRPFRVPGYPLVPAVYLCLTTAALGFAFGNPDREQQRAAIAGFGGVLAAVPAYGLARLARGANGPARPPPT